MMHIGILQEPIVEIILWQEVPESGEHGTKPCYIPPIPFCAKQQTPPFHPPTHAPRLLQSMTSVLINMGKEM
jgi:hypothetical protein